MITDLLTFLAIQEIERCTSGLLPREEAEGETLALATRLSGGDGTAESTLRCSPQERHILNNYLALELTDLDGLSDAAHAWLLERLCLFPEVLRELDAERALRLYFLRPDPAIRGLTVRAALALDSLAARERDVPAASHLNYIWEPILHDQGLTEEQAREAVQTLADLLVDLMIEWEDRSADRALRELLRSTRRTGDRPWLPDYLAQRARELGENVGLRLREITDTGEDHPQPEGL